MTNPNDHGASTLGAEIRAHFIARAAPPNDLRELLKTLSFWAYQAQFKLDPTGMVNTAQENYSGVNPMGQLYRMACATLGFPQTRWPAGLPEASTAFTELRSLLRSIEKHYGKTQTTKSLERIEELVESILGEEPMEAKEPVEGPAREPTVEEPKPKKGPGGRKKKVTLEHIKDYGENIKDKLPGVTLKILSDRWGIAKSTIADTPFWKKLRGQKMIARERAQNKSKPKTPKGIERRAVASQNWHEEDMKKIDEDLDGDS